MVALYLVAEYLVGCRHLVGRVDCLHLVGLDDCRSLALLDVASCWVGDSAESLPRRLPVAYSVAYSDAHLAACPDVYSVCRG